MKYCMLFAVAAVMVLLLSGCSYLGFGGKQGEQGPVPNETLAPSGLENITEPHGPGEPKLPIIPGKDNATNGEAVSTELSYTYSPLSNITVCFIDVGQGDSVLVKKGNFDMLIDAGSETAGPHVVSLLDELEVDDIEILMLSSMTDDRLDGMKSVLQSYNVEQFWGNGVSYLEGDVDYDHIINALNNMNAQIVHPTRGYHLYENGISIDVLHPGEDRLDTSENPEADSLTLLIKDRNFSVFLSDLSTNTQNNLLSRYPNITAKIMKVSQHGGGSTGAEERVGSFLLIDKLSPEVAVVSVGPNDRGLPNPTILESYRIHNVDIYRTDTQGTVCITSDGSGYNVTTSK